MFSLKKKVSIIQKTGYGLQNKQGAHCKEQNIGEKKVICVTKKRWCSLWRKKGAVHRKLKERVVFEECRWALCMPKKQGNLHRVDKDAVLSEKGDQGSDKNGALYKEEKGCFLKKRRVYFTEKRRVLFQEK